MTNHRTIEGAYLAITQLGLRDRCSSAVGSLLFELVDADELEEVTAKIFADGSGLQLDDRVVQAWVLALHSLDMLQTWTRTVDNQLRVCQMKGTGSTCSLRFSPSLGPDPRKIGNSGRERL